jgi:hypothetical protein
LFFTTTTPLIFTTTTLLIVLFRNGEQEPLVYATSPTEIHASSLWSEDKRVPDILNDLNGNTSVVKKGNQLGTLTGVFCPTIQNIFGVILFIRMSWIVGVCGFVEVIS